jgi:hypothetical protein
MKYQYAAVIVALLVGSCSAANGVQISGSIYGYDPIMHLVRHTHAENVDIVILKVSRGVGKKYVKVVIRSFGETLPESSFGGRRMVRLSAVRDKQCDEAAPSFIAKGILPTESGHYVLSPAYDNQAGVEISDVPCYVVRSKYGAE